MLKVALLGATSHVAKNLIYQNSLNPNWDLYLFARNTEKLQLFLSDNNINNVNNISFIDDFEVLDAQFDAVINCVGYGTPEKIKEAGIDLFLLTESIDNLIIEYLKKYSETSYINFSSGAVYGTSMDKPVNLDYESKIGIQPLEDNEFYRISKLNSEAKHRALKTLNIIDIRLFSFFSCFIDLRSRFLLTEIVNSLKNSNLFKTFKSEIYRDYISPSDLFSFVKASVELNGVNIALDTYSKKAVSKSELLSAIVDRFGMNIDYIESIEPSPTGIKTCYYSTYKQAEKVLDYYPSKTSIESIIEEIEHILR